MNKGKKKKTVFFYIFFASEVFLSKKKRSNFYDNGENCQLSHGSIPFYKKNKNWKCRNFGNTF